MARKPTQQQPEDEMELNTNIEAMTDEEMDAEIRRIELETKRITLRQAKAGLQKFDDDEKTKLRKAEAAQKALRAEAFGKKQTAAQCVHQLGGYGNEDTYNGDDKPSIVISDLPIAGMRMVMCVRCPKEWRSPDPRLKKTDPEAWADQAAEWKEALQLIKRSRAKAMGGPTFGFETMAGEPIHPQLV